MSQQNNNNNTDPMIMFKSCKVGENKKGNMYLTLNLSPEEAAVLLEQADKGINDRGLQIQIHTSERQSKDGRTFLGAVAFVRGIPEPPKPSPAQRDSRAGGGSSNGGGSSRLQSLRNGRGGKS